MSNETTTAPAADPRCPSSEVVHAVADRVRQWTEAAPNVRSAALFTHPDRPTVRVAVVSQAREYDPELDEAVTRLDLELAQDPALNGIDAELRLFFAAMPNQVAAWARGVE